MKMVKGRGDVRWLPSRYRFAAFRLLAYVIFRSSGPKQKPGIIVSIDRDQNAIESHLVGTWVTITTACFAFWLLDHWLPWPIALLLAPFIASLFLQLLCFWSLAGPAGWRWQNRVDLNSFLFLFVIIVASIYFAQAEGWVRYVAWIFLAGAAINALAAIVARLMRTRLQATEGEAGAG